MTPILALALIFVGVLVGGLLACVALALVLRSRDPWPR
jgi:hypothetical protein